MLEGDREGSGWVVSSSAVRRRALLQHKISKIERPSLGPPTSYNDKIGVHTGFCATFHKKLELALTHNEGPKLFFAIICEDLA